MTSTLNLRNADLWSMPNCLDEQSKHVALGDLHGNALKLIYVMIEEGVLKLHDDNPPGLSARAKYMRLRDIYELGVDVLSKHDIGKFKTIIDEASVYTNKAVTLIGDEVADRGNNDYFTLLVLKKLNQGKVKLDITLSNHGLEFIKDYFRNNFTGKSNLRSEQGQSLKNMHRLIERGLVQENEVREMVQTDYLPLVKAISYSISPKGVMTLFSHAPVGLETVEALTERFALGVYDDRSPSRLAKTINGINKEVQSAIKSKNLTRFIEEEKKSLENVVIANAPIPPKAPLYRLIWNRVVGTELKTETINDLFKVEYVHGHIGPEVLTDVDGRSVTTHKNLDSHFGKKHCFKTNDKIKHFTRRSSDIHSPTLDELKTIDDELFTEHLIPLFERTKQLQSLGKNYPKYQPVAAAADLLCTQINSNRNKYLNTDSPEEKLKLLNKISDSISAAKTTFETHRGLWAGVPRVAKAVLGLLALATMLPALIIKCSAKKSIYETFYGTPKTDSALILEKLGEAIFDKQNTMKQNLKQLREIQSTSSTDKKKSEDHEGVSVTPGE